MCSGAGMCPGLTIDAYKHLVFVFGGCGQWDTGYQSHGWSFDIDDSNYTEAATELSSTSTGFRAVIENDLGNIFKYQTKILWVGFSDGGGMGMYMHWKDSLRETPASTPYQSSDPSNGKDGIGKVIALDYYAHLDYDNWLGSYSNHIDAKIYTNCNSITYSLGEALFKDHDPAVSAITMPAQAGYTFDTATTPTMNNIPYIQYKWTKFRGHPSCGAIRYAVHGLQSPAFSGYDALAPEWTSKCTANNDMDTTSHSTHVEVLIHADIESDILAWVTRPSWKFNPCYAMVSPDAVKSMDIRMAKNVEVFNGRRLSDPDGEGGGEVKIPELKTEAMKAEKRTTEEMEKPPVVEKVEVTIKGAINPAVTPVDTSDAFAEPGTRIASFAGASLDMKKVEAR
jgi:hypothetical protein